MSPWKARADGLAEEGLLGQAAGDDLVGPSVTEKQQRQYEEERGSLLFRMAQETGLEPKDIARLRLVDALLGACGLYVRKPQCAEGERFSISTQLRDDLYEFTQARAAIGAPQDPESPLLWSTPAAIAERRAMSNEDTARLLAGSTRAGYASEEEFLNHLDGLIASRETAPRPTDTGGTEPRPSERPPGSSTAVPPAPSVMPGAPPNYGCGTAESAIYLTATTGLAPDPSLSTQILGRPDPLGRQKDLNTDILGPMGLPEPDPIEGVGPIG